MCYVQVSALHSERVLNMEASSEITSSSSSVQHKAVHATLSWDCWGSGFVRPSTVTSNAGTVMLWWLHTSYQEFFNSYDLRGPAPYTQSITDQNVRWYLAIPLVFPLTKLQKKLQPTVVLSSFKEFLCWLLSLTHGH